MHMAARDYSYTDIKRLLTESIDSINDGTRVVQKGDSVKLYLAMAELAVLKNWADLRGEPEKYAVNIPSNFSKPTEISEWCVKAKPAWTIFSEEINRINTEKSSSARKFWGEKLAMPETCP